MFCLFKGPLGAIAGVCSLLAVGAAQATVFQIERFEVTESGQTYWLDEFNDGAAPADRAIESPAIVDVNLYNRDYLLSGGALVGRLAGPETGGKLAMDVDQGFLGPSAINPGQMVKTQRVRVASGTNPANSSALVISESIALTGVFDLIAPELGESYRVRFTDWDDIARNESLELGIWRRNSDNEVVVSFRKGIVGGGFTILDELVFSTITNLMDYEQIALSLFNDPQTGGALFTASAELVDLDNAGNNQSWVASLRGSMFNARPIVRPEFIAVTSNVPVPATWALIALAALAMTRRRRPRD